MNRRNRSHILLIAGLCAGLALVSSCSKAPEKIIEDSRLFMGTIVRIKVSIDPSENGEKKAKDAINRAYQEIKRVEDIYSVFKEGSEISKINRLSKDERLQITDEVFSLIHKALVYSEKTDGVFDITVKPLVDLWNRAKKTKTLPGDDEVKSVLERIGYKNVVLDPEARTISFKKDGMCIDLGGVAKGYATDRAISVLKDNGINNALVTSGGDMYCLGKKSVMELWKVGIRHPRRIHRVLFEILLKDRAISTSGDYERYFILNGKRYSHIIDPRTGYPIGDDVVSASVISGDSTTSDILATAVCILGEKGFDVIKRQPGGADTVLVKLNDGRLIVKMSEGIKERYDISQERL